MILVLGDLLQRCQRPDLAFRCSAARGQGCEPAGCADLKRGLRWEGWMEAGGGCSVRGRPSRGPHARPPDRFHAGGACRVCTLGPVPPGPVSAPGDGAPHAAASSPAVALARTHSEGPTPEAELIPLTRPGLLALLREPPSCPRPGATWPTSCTGRAGAAATSTAQRPATAAGTRPPLPRPRNR